MIRTNCRSRLLAAVALLAASPVFAQTQAPASKNTRVAVQNATPPAAALPVELQPDANRTREQLHALLERHAPALRKVLALDPSLLSNEAYLASYPGVAAFLATHPDVVRNPAYYLGNGEEFRREPGDRVIDLSSNILGGMAAFIGVGMAIGLITWLIRTLVDYRRWSRLSKVQTEVHTKLLDRFSSSDELAAYIQSPAGAKFLESSPIKLDPGPRALGAPFSRILWSLQGGVVLVCVGAGLWIVSSTVKDEAAQAVQSFGVLALSLGCGFVLSAILSYVVSRRLGLIDASQRPSAAESSSV